MFPSLGGGTGAGGRQRSRRGPAGSRRVRPPPAAPVAPPGGDGAVLAAHLGFWAPDNDPGPGRAREIYTAYPRAIKNKKLAANMRLETPQLCLGRRQPAQVVPADGTTALIPCKEQGESHGALSGLLSPGHTCNGYSVGKGNC
ncbi:uncharacterized protein FN964_000554 isoform 1-T1 [Alca torda]